VIRALRGGLALIMLLSIVAIGTSAASADSSSRPTFIVTLRDGNPQAVAAEHARRYGAEIEFVYEHALQGYAAQISEARIGELARDRRVARIERDQVVHAVELVEQSGPTWGLDRIDDRAGLDKSYTYEATGAGVTAYIIDTGIRVTHDEFGNRASHGRDVFSDGRNGDDCNGHGTHVAGTVGGSTYGVAKAVNLVAVRVLDCNGSGTWAGVIAGIDWVTANAAKPAVANMSLGGGASTSVDDAVRNSISRGISYAVAAGNGNRAGVAQDACNYSPARVPEAMTIGASTQSDAKTSWSNYGSCVDWFAPGYQITSAWIDSDTDTNTISGTSMATPHTAGAAALYLESNTSATPAAVSSALQAATTKDVVTSSSTANNDLLYTLEFQGSTEPPPPVTQTTISGSCSKTTCTFDAVPNVQDPNWTVDSGQPKTGDPVSYSFIGGDTYLVTLSSGSSFVDDITVDCTTLRGKNHHCSVSG